MAINYVKPAKPSAPISYHHPRRAPITPMSPLGNENSVRLSAARPTITIPATSRRS